MAKHMEIKAIESWRKKTRIFSSYSHEREEGFAICRGSNVDSVPCGTRYVNGISWRVAQNQSFRLFIIIITPLLSFWALNRKLALKYGLDRAFAITPILSLKSLASRQFRF